MTDAKSLGLQLYSKLAQLLAPENSLTGTPFMLLMEPSGKDIDPEDFQNEDDEISSDLVNSIPIPNSMFIDSSRLYDRVYQLIVESAITDGNPDNPVSVNAARNIERARFDIESMVRASQADPMDEYYPVHLNPSRWWDMTSQWTDVSFSIGQNDPSEFIMPKCFVKMKYFPSLAWRDIPKNASYTELATHVRSQGYLSLKKTRKIRARSEMVRRITPSLTIENSERSRPVLHIRGDNERHIIPNLSINGLKRRSITTDLLSTVKKFEEKPEKLRYKDLIQSSRILDEKAVVSDVKANSKGFQINFQYCVVDIERPWLHREFFDLPGWQLPGFAAHAISNGQSTNNLGLLPVITTSFLAVRNLEVHGSWLNEDQKKAVESTQATGLFSFGPFALGSGTNFDGVHLSRPTPQIVAWLGALVPSCPINLS